MRTLGKLLIAVLLVLPAQALPAEKGLIIKSARFFSYASFTRIVFEIETAAPYVLTKADDGRSLTLSAYDAALTLKSPLPQINDGIVSGMERREEPGRTVIVIRLDSAAGEVKDFVLRGPDRIVVDIAKGTAPAAMKPGSQVVVVLDAGHGGGDAGAETAQGPEKNITLAMAQALRRSLQKDPRIRIVMTRDRDQTLSLNDRASIANSADAVVFVSIHAAPGVNDRVYIQDPEEDPGAPAVRPAGRDFLSFETGSERQEMLWGRQQAAHARESGSLGRILARQLGESSGAEPQQVPLAGLKAVDAAAVMIEFGAGKDRTKAVESAARGIEEYVREIR